MLDRVSKSSAIDLRLRLIRLKAFSPKNAEINFYRIAQEPVNKVVKYSGAPEADVRIRRGAAEMRLSGWDNGKGFDTNSIATGRAEQSGFGLA